MELYSAIQSGDLNAVQTIIGANPEIANKTDQRGFTPLILATYLEKKEVSEFLIDHGADIDAQDASGNTALMGVSHKGHQEITRMLLSKGADIDIKNDDGDTALDFAIRSGNTAIEELLRGAEIT